jgi:hypothetical protein
MFNKLFPSLAVLLFSSLVMLNLAGCGGNSSNESENANNEAEAGTKKAELTASTPEEYTQSVLALLVANEPERFIEFAFPTKEELLAFVAAHVPEDRKETVMEQIDTEYAEQKAKVLASFGELRKAVEKAGGDWKSIKTTSTNYDLQTRDGVTGTNIDVVISAGNQNVEMKLDDCLLINGRWYTTDEMKLTGEFVNPVNGKITYDGKPLAGARIRLEATTHGASRVYTCDSKSDGTFEIVAVYSTGVKKGAPVGSYKVLVGKFERDTTDAADEVAELELIEQQIESGENVVEAASAKTQINEKFNNSSTTPLRVDVVPGVNNITIDLKSDGTGTVK